MDNEGTTGMGNHTIRHNNRRLRYLKSGLDILPLTTISSSTSSSRYSARRFIFTNTYLSDIVPYNLKTKEMELRGRFGYHGFSMSALDGGDTASLEFWELVYSTKEFNAHMRYLTV